MERLASISRTPTLSLEDLVTLANDLLLDLVPADPTDARMRSDLSPRLVRHLATLGIVDEPARAGREARYSRRHVLQLLAVRRLMAEGYPTPTIKKLMAGQDDSRLEALVGGGATVKMESAVPEPQTIQHEAFGATGPVASAEPNEALRYLSRIRGQTRPARQAAVLSTSGWQRIEVAPGIEIQIRDDVALPAGASERQRVLRHIFEQLEAVLNQRS